MKCFITFLYRSPSQSNVDLGEFQDGLEATFSNLILESPFFSIILGDFNAKCSKWFGDIDETCGLELESLSNYSGYSQIITKATHFQPNCSSSYLVSHSGVHALLYNTCHYQIIFAKIDLKIHLPPSYKREILTYSKAEEELIKQGISNFNWIDALSNINTNKQVDLLTSTLLNIFRNFIPHKTIACKYNDPPWITSKIKTMLRKKNRLYRKYIANGWRDDGKLALDELSMIQP